MPSDNAPNSQRKPDGWIAYCKAFHELFGSEKKVELSAAALDEMAAQLSGGPEGGDPIRICICPNCGLQHGAAQRSATSDSPGA